MTTLRNECYTCDEYLPSTAGCLAIAHGLKCRQDRPQTTELANETRRQKDARLSALATQISGSRSPRPPISPTEFIHRNGIGFCEGMAIEYLCRWRAEDGVEDLKKARHFIDLLIEMEDPSNG